MDLFSIIKPSTAKVPILISVPHAGTFIPDNIKEQMNPDLVDSLDDTDWFVDKLYRFASDMGITMIVANYSRWVIDLNRDPKSDPLYDDGRIITGLVSKHSFLGEAIYRNNIILAPSDTELRLANYYWPYYNEIATILSDLKSKFGKALLFDAHSIRKNVATIQDKSFPDLILGDNDEKSADNNLIDKTLTILQNSDYEVSHNTPFKGGHLMRYFGNPAKNIHALQLEMAKINYMNDTERKYDEERAKEMQVLLKKMFEDLVGIL